MADAPDSAWYYAVGGQRQTGPVTLAALAELFRAEKIGAATLVWTQGMADWQPLSRVDELRFLLPAAPPTLPGPVRPPASPAGLGDDDLIRWLLPVGRSYWAILSGYMGLFGLFPTCGVVLGPAAI